MSKINVQLDITTLTLTFEPNMASPHGTEYQNEKKRKIPTLEDRVNAGESARAIVTFPFMQVYSETTCLVRPLSRGSRGGL